MRLAVLNPLTPRSDQHLTSPCNICTLPSKQIPRIRIGNRMNTSAFRDLWARVMF